jgi:hypothetical protein
MVILGCTTVAAQVPQIPDSLTPRTLVARTERLPSTHSTSLAADYHLSQGLLSGVIQSYLVSSTTLLASRATTDQIDSHVDLEYRLPGSMRFFMLAEGTLNNAGQSDLSRIPGLNNTSATLLGIGGRVYDKDSNHVGLAFGGTYNRQLNQEDVGAAVYGEITGATDIDGYRVQLDGRGRWYNISPRHNSNGYLDLRAMREFEEGARGEMNARYELINTDLYIKRNEDDIIQYGGLTYDGLRLRNEHQWHVNTTFFYPASDNLAVDMLIGVVGTTIAQQESDKGLPPLARVPDPFHYSRQSMGLTGGIGARLTPPHMTVGMRLDYASSDELNTIDPTGTVSEAELRRKRDIGRQSDFSSQQLMLSGVIEHRPWRYDTLSIGGAIGIYRYDTPDTNNNFDKDEQSIRGEVRYARSFSPFLTFAIQGQVFLTHLVYLFGENSNDNNWNRVFRLMPTVRYTIENVLRNDMEAEVLANYTQYDFEGRTQTIRGRSFREIRLRDSLAFAITPTLVFWTQGELRISERSSFDWEQFAESPLERIRTEGIEAAIATTTLHGMSFSGGARLSRAKTYMANNRGELEPSSDRTSVGPTAHISMMISDRTELQFSGWWEHRFEESELVARVPMLFMTIGMKL